MKILAFGIAKEIFGTNSLQIDLEDGATSADLKALLESKFPRLQKLSSYMIAINNEYSVDNQIINTVDEVAIIPPVSGG